MDRRQWLEEKRREALGLADVATHALVPSRRDFTQFLASQRRDLALVPRLKRRDGRTGGSFPGVDVVALATALDDTDVAALAVATAAVHGAAPADLDSVRAAVGAPLLRDDLCIDEAQVYDSRLRGADAVRLPVADLAPGELGRLCDIAVSLHLTPVLEIGRGEELEAAPLRPPHCVGLDCAAADGFADLAAARALAAAVPAHVVVLLLAEPRSLDEARSLRGWVDAVVVGDALLAAAEPLAEVDRFLGMVA